MGWGKLYLYVCILTTEKDENIINQLIGILTRYLEKRGRLPGEKESPCQTGPLTGASNPQTLSKTGYAGSISCWRPLCKGGTENMYKTLTNQTCADLENMCDIMKDDLFRLDYCVNKILELSAITTDTQDAVYQFAQSRSEIYSCADIACDYLFRLRNALDSMKKQYSGCEETEVQE